MSYTIQYEPEKNRKYPDARKRRNRVRVRVLAVLLLIAFVGFGIRAGWLLPGDPDVTADAFTQMMNSLQEGETVKDAVTVFCLEVLENG